PTAAKPRTHQAVQVSDKVRKAMTDLRAALVAGGQERIDGLSEALEELKETEKVELDDEIGLTDGARKATPIILKAFSARQIASFVGDNAEEFPDPLEKIVEAFDDVRALPAKEWEAERDGVADQVGWLVGGLDADAEKKAKGQVVALLNKVRALNDADFKAKRADLEKEARAAAAAGPTEVIRHFVQHSL